MLKIDWNETELIRVKKRIPAVGSVLESYGELSLADYFRSLKPPLSTPIQPRADFIEVSTDYARELLGAPIAARLAAHLESSPILLTANHLGVDYHPFVFQGNVLFGLTTAFADMTAPGTGRVMPVMAFGSVSLGNQVYTRGIILSREAVTDSEVLPEAKAVRIGIFPASLRRTAASFAPPFSPAMVNGALDTIRSQYRTGVIGEKEAAVLIDLLENEYLKADVIELTNYSDQASLLNHRLWPRLFTEEHRGSMPDLVSMEIERVVSRLVEKDIFNRDSLLFRILFDRDLRDGIMKNLEGVFGCWDRGKLVLSLDKNLRGAEREDALSKCGTSFFWGRSPKGRLVRLVLVSRDGREYLTGLDEYGNDYTFDFTPDGIAKGLLDRRLLPGLFTVFLEVAFARGIKCFGGFFQTGYLPIMQHGLANALKNKGYSDWSEKVSVVPANDYITGMTVILAEYHDQVQPAGMIEVLAGDGLSRRDLSNIMEMSVDQANVFGLVEICRNFAVEGDGDSNRVRLIDDSHMERIINEMVKVKLQDQGS